MLSYIEVKPRVYIVLDGEPYEVIASSVAKKNRQKPVNQTKLKNLISGSIVERAFHQSDKIEKADIDTKKITYLYNNKGELWFSETDNPKERFSLSEEMVGSASKFLKEKASVDALLFSTESGKEIIGIKVPIKVELKVREAPPAVRGNTAQGANKQVTLETGVEIMVPIFINEGDTVRINTETEAYVERVEKG